MTIEQTVEIPANRRITLELPCEVPEGKVVLTFTPAQTDPLQGISRKKTPVFGCARGQFRMADDFDAMPEDFREYM
jgi:hypothetical protein